MKRQALGSDSFTLLRSFSLNLLFVLALPFFMYAQNVPANLAAHKQLLLETTHGALTVKEGPAGTLYVLNRSVPISSVWITDYSGVSQRMIVSTLEDPELRTPRDLAVDREGNAIVLNGSGLIKVFSTNGKQLSSFQVERPHAVGVLSDGRILVSGFPREHLMFVYSREGTLLAEIGEPAKVDSLDAFDIRMMNMGHIVVDREDNIYYVFRYLLTPTVRKYTPSGNLVAEWHPEGAHLDWAVAQAKKEVQRRQENAEHGASAILTAGAFDDSTNTLWLASDEAVFQLDGSGHTIRSFSLTKSDGGPVQAFGLAVSTEFLCAAGPFHGTFEFIKPK